MNKKELDKANELQEKIEMLEDQLNNIKRYNHKTILNFMYKERHLLVYTAGYHKSKTIEADEKMQEEIIAILEKRLEDYKEEFKQIGREK